MALVKQLNKSTRDSLQLLLIGDSGVGKTSILSRFAEEDYNESFISTIGIDFKVRTVEIDGKTIKLQIWDTAGQERFRTITTAYYRGAMGIMLVYDVTTKSSFDNINNWIQNVSQYANTGVVKMLLGNKCDSHSNRQVFQNEAIEASVIVHFKTFDVFSSKGTCLQLYKKLAKANDMRFMETSAKCGKNVDMAFRVLAEDIKLMIESKNDVNNTPSEDVRNLSSSRSKRKLFPSSCTL